MSYHYTLHHKTALVHWSACREAAGADQAELAPCLAEEISGRVIAWNRKGKESTAFPHHQWSIISHLGKSDLQASWSPASLFLWRETDGMLNASLSTILLTTSIYTALFEWKQRKQTSSFAPSFQTHISTDVPGPRWSAFSILLWPCCQLFPFHPASLPNKPAACVHCHKWQTESKNRRIVKIVRDHQGHLVQPSAKYAVQEGVPTAQSYEMSLKVSQILPPERGRVLGLLLPSLTMMCWAPQRVFGLGSGDTGLLQVLHNMHLAWHQR